MTVRSWSQLACDAPGCRSDSGRCYGDHGWVRSKMADQGWTFDPIHGDRCPKHAADDQKGVGDA